MKNIPLFENSIEEDHAIEEAYQKALQTQEEGNITIDQDGQIYYKDKAVWNAQAIGSIAEKRFNKKMEMIRKQQPKIAQNGD